MQCIAAVIQIVVMKRVSLREIHLASHVELVHVVSHGKESNAMRYCITPYYTMPHYTTSCHAISCHSIPHQVAQCHAAPRISRHPMPHIAWSQDTMHRHATPRGTAIWRSQNK